MLRQSLFLAGLACFVLVHGVPTPGGQMIKPPALTKNASSYRSLANKDTSAFSLIMAANQNNQQRSSDGIELFQGDIIMTPDIKQDLRYMGLDIPNNNQTNNKTKPRPKRAAMSYKHKRWMGSDGRPLIPYFIDRSKVHMTRLIKASMRHWTQNVPCLRFKQRTNERNYLRFYRGGGCFSNVGRIGGGQRISIGSGCNHLHVIVHEIGHALGFWHEQSRPDRDRYVRIYWNRIDPNFRYAFHMFSDGRINSLGVPYDYNSVMHYNSKAFGRGRTTITRINGDTRLGNNRGLSAKDIKQAKLLYCGNTRPRPPTPRPPTGCKERDLSDWCTHWARQGYCSRSSQYYHHMSKKCRKSCFCKSSICENKRPHCRAWSASGHCNGQYKKYMHTYCRKSCRLCR